LNDKKWHITAIEQQAYTNPTFINQQRVLPGESRPLRNGDRLTLSGVMLTVRIIEF
jgi:predicted component of type VI protein secretion system